MILNYVSTVCLYVYLIVIFVVLKLAHRLFGIQREMCIPTNQTINKFKAHEKKIFYYDRAYRTDFVRMCKK